MARPKGQTDTRELILQAANRVVQEQGVATLTLEAVAYAAGVSKGGLLYHFPTKEALIEAMLMAMLACQEQDMQVALAQEAEADAPGRWSRAYIRATFDAPVSVLANDGGLIASFALHPGLMTRIRAWYEEQAVRETQDGIDPTLATTIRLAVDGLWFADLFGLAPPSVAQREEIARFLVGLTTRH